MTEQDKTDARAALQRYLRDEMEIEAGDLAAGLLLDFFLSEIGPTLYNEGVSDAQAYLRKHVADLDTIVHRMPFPSQRRR